MRLQRDVESCVQMRLYNMNRCHILMIFLGIFTAFTIALTIGLHGPSVLQEYSLMASKLPKVPNDFRSGPFRLAPPPLSVFHQEIWLSAFVKRAEVNAHTGLFLTFNASVDVSVRNSANSDHVVTADDHEKKFIPIRSTAVRSVTLHCLHTVCDELFLAHIAPVDFTMYRFTVRFHGLSSESQTSESSRAASAPVVQLTDVTFVFRYYNPEFTYMELVSRFVFFSLMEVITILFLGSLRHFALRDWTIEQRCTAFLLPALLFYNNPVYPIRFFSNNWFPQFLDYVFQITFLSIVLLFWLVIYHGLRSVKRTICAFYMPKVMVVLTLWLPFIGLSLWKTYNEYTDASFNVASLPGAVYVQGFLVLCGLIYLLFLIVLMIRAFAELRKLPYYNLRLKVLTALSVFAVSASLASLFLRFGSGLIVGKQYTSDGTSAGGGVSSQSVSSSKPTRLLVIPGDRSALEFTLIYTIWNAYLATFALMYSPSSDASREVHFKDDPSVSMINDSDEEVIYDSDAESTQLTLRAAT